MTRAEIRDRVVELLARNFQLQPGEIRGGSRLFEDLDLDSIDAVDMFAELFTVTGHRIDPETVPHLRTVDDVITFVEGELSRTA
ncbi:MAG: acyl carrier protein [Nannocystaceae bacterium]|nr:acyl carrier protein [Myxococcales bacterium]